jgi:hypothetical protein
VDENDPTVILKNGVRIEADLVVGADGDISQNFLEFKSSIDAWG